MKTIVQGDPSMFMGQGRDRELKADVEDEINDEKNPLLNAIEGEKDETESQEEKGNIKDTEEEQETPIPAESDVQSNEGVLN